MRMLQFLGLHYTTNLIPWEKELILIFSPYFILLFRELSFNKPSKEDEQVRSSLASNELVWKWISRIDVG